MSSTNSAALGRLIGWIATNLAILVAYVYVIAIAYGAVGLAASWIRGDGGPTLPQFKEAFAGPAVGGFYLVIYSPLAALCLIPYRLAVHIFGHARLIGFGAAAGLGALTWAVSPTHDTAQAVALGGLLGGYAAVLRVPGQEFGSMPSVVRWAIAGLLFSWVWIIGSFVAVAWAARKATRDQWTEAGALAVVATLGPGVLLLADLFRDDVPSGNHVATAALLAGSLFGMVLLGVGWLRRAQMYRRSA